MLLSAGRVVDHPDLYPGLAIRDNTPAKLLRCANGNLIPNSGPLSAVNRYYVNQGSTTVSGLDFEVAHRLSLGDKGRLSNKLDYNYAISCKRQEMPGDYENNLVGTYGGAADWATTVGDIPRHRATLSTAWTMGVHTVTGSIDYVSPVSLYRRYDSATRFETPFCYYGSGKAPAGQLVGGLPRFTNWVSDCSVPEWTTVNEGYTYTGFKNWTVGQHPQPVRHCGAVRSTLPERRFQPAAAQRHGSLLPPDRRLQVLIGLFA